MIDNGFAPVYILQSMIINFRRGARANVADSNMYRSIAISNLMRKIFYNIIIEQQRLVLSTSNHQFGFTSRSCIMFYYSVLQSVYLVVFDASKAFDIVLS